MIEILKEVEQNLVDLLLNNKLYSMYIDYHKPYVERIFFYYKEYKVYLHRIHNCEDSNQALFHPHPWESAIKIIKGKYEMGIGHSETSIIPKIDCKLILKKGTIYEMLEPDGWHYVRPISKTSVSLMVTGKKNNREMPLKPAQPSSRKLSEKEIFELLIDFKIVKRRNPVGIKEEILNAHLPAKKEYKIDNMIYNW